MIAATPTRDAGSQAATPVDHPDAQVLRRERPRLAMLTTGTRHAAAILDALADRGLRPTVVLLEVPRGRAALRRVLDAVRRRGARATLSAIVRRGRRRLRPSDEPWHDSAFYADRTERLVTVASLTAAEALQALRETDPDLLVLGGAPILPADLLRVPRVGTLNAHPGILPRFRGVDVVAHAVLAGGPIGATVHWVDAGIDTGRIVATVEVAPEPGDDLARLQERVETAGAAALADAVDRLVRGEELETLVQTERFPLCRRLTPVERARADARLRGS